MGRERMSGEARDIYAMEEELRRRDEELRARAAETVQRAQQALRAQDECRVSIDDANEMRTSVDDSLDLDIPRGDPIASSSGRPVSGARGSWGGRVLRQIEDQVVGDRPSSRPSPRPAQASTSASRESMAPTEGREAGGRPNAPNLAPDMEVKEMPEVTLRLYRAKVTALEATKTELQAGIAERDRQLAEALRELKVLRAERDTWEKQLKAAEQNSQRHQARADKAEQDARAAQAEAQRVRREALDVEKSHRAAVKDNKSRDVRLNRALEEVDRLKNLLEEYKSQKTAATTVSQGEFERVMAENKKLERQKQELLAGFRKQMRLIDVLKRQKIHLEAARMLAFTEDEFMRALEAGGGR